eukprot:scaffold60838_cov16-Tisochrysis_lutea.AAC.1
MNIVQLCEAPERKLQTMCSPDWRAISSMSKPKGPAVLSVGKGRVFPSVSVKPPPFCVRLDPTLVSPSVSVKPPPLPRGVSSLWAWLVATVTTSDQVRPACWLVTVRVVRYSQCHSFGSPNSDLEVTQPFPLLALPPHPSFLILLPAVTCFPRSTLNPCMSGEQIVNAYTSEQLVHGHDTRGPGCHGLVAEGTCMHSVPDFKHDAWFACIILMAKRCMRTRRISWTVWAWIRSCS